MADLPESTSPDEAINSVDNATTSTSFKGLFIESLILHYLPKGIGKFFPQLEILYVTNTFLKSIKAADLEGLPNLKILYLGGNDIEELSSDLFKFTPKLVDFSCPRNKISRVGKDLFESLQSLNVVNLQCNKCINNLKIADFVALKNELRIQCADPMEMEANYCPEDLERYANDIDELKIAIESWKPTCFKPDWTDLLRNRTVKLEECRKVTMVYKLKVQNKSR